MSPVPKTSFLVGTFFAVSDETINVKGCTSIPKKTQKKHKKNHSSSNLKGKNLQGFLFRRPWYIFSRSKQTSSFMIRRFSIGWCFYVLILSDYFLNQSSLNLSQLVQIDLDLSELNLELLMYLIVSTLRTEICYPEKYSYTYFHLSKHE